MERWRDSGPKVADRIQDGKVLALVKQFLKSTGRRGMPQGSPLSPLLANLALNDLDHALDRGQGYLTYVRYLDDMVVLVPNSARGLRWADRALARIRREADAIGVSINEDKTRQVCCTDPKAMFSFLGFDFRWKPSPRTGRWFACNTPRPRKVVELQRNVRRFAAKKQGRRGFGWKRWSSDVVYGVWGLFSDYRKVYLDIAKVGLPLNKEA